jgi:hypothetical protein
MRNPLRVLLPVVLFLLLAAPSGAQDPSGLFFREDWKETPAEMPLGQAHVSDPNLFLQQYGPGIHGIKKSNHPSIPNDPYYVWSGACPGNWAVTLKHKTNDVDLTGPALIRWRAKQAGFRVLHVILKLSSGTWLVSDWGDDASNDWRVREVRVRDIHWRTLDISRVSEGRPAEKPDLSRVEEIGFTDLMPGGLSDACSRLDWIEVHGKPAARTPQR